MAGAEERGQPRSSRLWAAEARAPMGAVAHAARVRGCGLCADRFAWPWPGNQKRGMACRGLWSWQNLSHTRPAAPGVKSGPQTRSLPSQCLGRHCGTPSAMSASPARYAAPAVRAAALQPCGPGSCLRLWSLRPRPRPFRRALVPLLRLALCWQPLLGVPSAGRASAEASTPWPTRGALSSLR